MTYDPAARRQTPLASALAAQIRRDGPLPVDRYMARCLWDPDHGYYATRQPLGEAGDFTTAPEISQTFGEMIGLWAAVVWRDLMLAPLSFSLAELGPGRGTLMNDALRATGKLTAMRAAARCHLIELSAPLIDQQRRTLAGHQVPINWSDDLSAMPAPAIVIANEFFDALPVQQWIKIESGWAERRIGLDVDGRLCFETGPNCQISAELGDRFPSAAPGDVFEQSTAAPYIERVASLAAEGPVAALLIDYGHPRSAIGDTLQAVRRHAHEHPLTSPGEADLSTQVDFDALAATARRCGLAVDGPVTQAEFLGRLGIVERTSRLMAANPAKTSTIELAVARLITPNGMGSRFKVLGLRSPGLPPLPGLEPATSANY